MQSRIKTGVNNLSFSLFIFQVEVCDFCDTAYTGASHASHLGCPSAYSSRLSSELHKNVFLLSYIKKRQVWKSRSETDWPHLGIMPGFSTEKNPSILMLASTCWQKISLSNTVELTTVTPQKQKICHLNIAFCQFSKIPEVPLSAYAQQNPVTCHDWVVLFLRTSAGCHTEMGTCENKTA